MKQVIDRDLCTGCAACYSACPAECIHMVRNAEGFLYPEISDDCLNCGKCVKICPRLNDNAGEVNIEQKAFAGVSKDNKIWRRSSSGGAFSELCAVWGDEDTLFCSAAWNELDVHNICVIGKDKIAPLCKSKYISSDVKDTFKQIKKHLDDGKKALFCSTPCQVAGLKSFLGKEYEKLLLIDLICHGVGSPLVFRKCVENMEKDFQSKVVSYEFRSKKKVYEQDHIAKLTLEKDKRNRFYVNDRYIQLFIKQHCLRKSCGKNCIYRNQNRQGDITIGDFKGLTKVFPNLKGTKKNYSTIVFNTEKGMNLYQGLLKRMNLLECKCEDIKQHNPLFFRNTYFSEQRDDFFAEFIANPEQTILNWTDKPKRHRRSFRRKIYDWMPVKLRAKFFGGR